MIEVIRKLSLGIINKKHQCYSCLRDFSPGKKMYSATYSNTKVENIYTLYQCNECHQFLLDANEDILSEIVHNGIVGHGVIDDFLFEHGGYTIEMVDDFYKYWKEQKNEQ